MMEPRKLKEWGRHGYLVVHLVPLVMTRNCRYCAPKLAVLVLALIIRNTRAEAHINSISRNDLNDFCATTSVHLSQPPYLVLHKLYSMSSSNHIL